MSDGVEISLTLGEKPRRMLLSTAVTFTPGRWAALIRTSNDRLPLMVDITATALTGNI